VREWERERESGEAREWGGEKKRKKKKKMRENVFFSSILE
jgi:hypothetical protein